MVNYIELVVEWLAECRYTASSIASGVSPLDHEPRHQAVELGALVVPATAELDKVPAGPRSPALMLGASVVGENYRFTCHSEPQC